MNTAIESTLTEFLLSAIIDAFTEEFAYHALYVLTTYDDHEFTFDKLYYMLKHNTSNELFQTICKFMQDFLNVQSISN